MDSVSATTDSLMESPFWEKPLAASNLLEHRTIFHTARFAGHGAHARNQATFDPVDLVRLDLRRPREEGDRRLVPQTT